MAYTYIDRVMGCLYGGAVGDALGYPVEFLEKEIGPSYNQFGYGCCLAGDYSTSNAFTALRL